MKRLLYFWLQFAVVPFCVILTTAFLGGCGPKQPGGGKSNIPTAPSSAGVALFDEVAKVSGVDFIHNNGADAKSPLFPETTPAGCALFDYDNDGWLDIILIQSGELSPKGKYVRPHCAVYHNNHDGTFTDVIAGSGLDFDLGYAHGIAVGDYDNDGFEDILITSYPRNFLFHNEKGTGKFSDVTKQMGLDIVHSTGYATSAAFGDYDNDGKLDIYICYYSPWTVATDKKCSDSQGRREYCSPEVYPMDSHVLLHNEGSHFVDVSEKSGINKVKGRGLAVAFYDYDEDGKQDIFVANDLSGNMLWHNDGKGKFTEKGAEAGCRYGTAGSLMAGMGIAIADYRQSGHESLFVTNFQDMPNMLFENTGKGYFEDKTVQSKVGPLHMPYLSFGCEFIDYDADGWPDIVTANGHVQMKGGGLASMNQSKQLLHNQKDGTFGEITEPSKLGSLAQKLIARGVAVGDFNNDGRQDLLFNNQNGPAQLFKNMDKSGNHWVSFKTVGTKSNRDGLHTRFLLTANGTTRAGTVRAGTSYLSVSDRRVYFGLGKETTITKVEIRWPSGTKEVLSNVNVDESYVVTEGKGITGKLPKGVSK